MKQILQQNPQLSKVIDAENGYVKVVTKFGILDTCIAPNRLQITQDMNVSLDTSKRLTCTAACKRALDQ